MGLWLNQIRGGGARKKHLVCDSSYCRDSSDISDSSDKTQKTETDTKHKNFKCDKIQKLKLWQN